MFCPYYVSYKCLVNHKQLDLGERRATAKPNILYSGGRQTSGAPHIR